MKLRQTKIPGCHEVQFDLRQDLRGNFVKIFNATEFERFGLEAGFSESFFTTSTSNVLRGMHFQLPPADGAKLVTCLSGRVMDVALDLRRDSPTFRQHEVFNLQNGIGAYIPRGVAHGFYVKEGISLLAYLVSGEYDAKLDTGILWSSIGVAWPCDAPIISARDAAFTGLYEFQTPFQMDGPI